MRNFDLGIHDYMDTRGGLDRILAGIGVGTMAMGAFGVRLFDPTSVSFLPPCPLLSLTGFACPGCGLTRGFHALSHGDILTALDFNALVPIWSIVIAYVFVSLLLTAFRGRGLPWRFVTPGVLIGSLVLLLVFGVLRNLSYYPFTVLFP